VTVCDRGEERGFGWCVRTHWRKLPKWNHAVFRQTRLFVNNVRDRNVADKRKLYFDLYSAYKSACPNKTGTVLQSEANKFWQSVKTKDDVADAVQEKLAELGNVKRQHTARLLSLWSQVFNSIALL